MLDIIIQLLKLPRKSNRGLRKNYVPYDLVVIQLVSGQQKLQALLWNLAANYKQAIFFYDYFHLYGVPFVNCLSIFIQECFWSDIFTGRQKEELAPSLVCSYSILFISHILVDLLRGKIFQKPDTTHLTANHSKSSEWF